MTVRGEVREEKRDIHIICACLRVHFHEAHRLDAQRPEALGRQLPVECRDIDALAAHGLAPRLPRLDAVRDELLVQARRVLRTPRVERRASRSRGHAARSARVASPALEPLRG